MNKPHHSDKHGHHKGGKASPTYATWKSMRTRCTNPVGADYDSYGGRGITVCKRWDKFENFLADMGERPQGRTLDRIKNHLGYAKSNCRWATPREQALNRRDNVNVHARGVTRCITDWGRSSGVTRHTIRNRLLAGWTPEEAIATPAHPTITFCGKTQSRAAWARETGIKATTIGERLTRGWSVQRALTTPTLRQVRA